jgi:hypothetical protein
MPPPPFLTLASSAPSEVVTTVPTPEPDIDLRAVVQSNFYVTLAIPRDTTTYTTTMLLAGTETAPPSNPTTTAISNPSVVSTQVVVTTQALVPVVVVSTQTLVSSQPAVSSSPTQTTAPITAAGSTDPSSSTVVGAIVGAIVGSFVMVFLLWCCLYQPRIFRIESSTVSGSTRSSSSGSTVKRTRRVRIIR